MAKSILRPLRAAQRAVRAEITSNAQGASRFAAGLAGEGYAGGYLDALYDVEAMLTHGFPSDLRGYWQDRAALSTKNGGDL